MEWGRSDSKEKVQTLHNVADLRAYTKQTEGKVFCDTFSQEPQNFSRRGPSASVRLHHVRGVSIIRDDWAIACFTDNVLPCLRLQA
jgi:hypothetical protein